MCAKDAQGDASSVSVITDAAAVAAPEVGHVELPALGDSRTSKHIHFDEGNLQENEAERLRVERMRIDEPKTPYHDLFAESHAGLGSLSASESSETEDIGRGCYVPGVPSVNAGCCDNQTALVNGGSGWTSRSSTPESSSSNASGRRLSHEEFEEKRRALYNDEYRMVRLYRQQLTNNDSNGPTVDSQHADDRDPSVDEQNSGPVTRPAPRHTRLRQRTSANSQKR
ncbi:hypothetical protein CCYA_CCYA17G4381 [Cyanidiococcus yangmingshanensis]|nr:hypothetical protein CCYA_CCYA17G4381 [Cyanidiococcus yangmingshanensis]